MKKIFLIVFSFCIYFHSTAQNNLKDQNIFIITTDGFRWQEVFAGADSSIINSTKYVQDTALIKDKFWDTTLQVRREKLLPFFWKTIAKKGQIFGNRNFKNEVNVTNIYKFSYPGYNEIFTGHADLRFIPNSPVCNKNINILEHLDKLETYKGKVVAFSSWDIFPFILNEPRSQILVNSGYEMLNETDSSNILINQVQNNVNEKAHTRYDLLTYASAKEYIEKNHPKVVALGFGETDEFAHQKKYDMYLNKAHQFDEMIAELWYYVQTDPFYKNNTTFIITTDHGRGKKQNTWNAHGFWIKGSGEAWLAMIGPNILPLGEIKNEQKIGQNQIANTVALLIGQKFDTPKKIGKPIAINADNKSDNNMIALAEEHEKIVTSILNK